jgi:hypothetical protein
MRIEKWSDSMPRSGKPERRATMATEGPKSAETDKGFVMVDGEPDEGGATKPGASLPQIDFSTFILSLGTSALFHMGVVIDPSSGESKGEPNMPLASQTIETLVMLEEKTRGNLSEEEGKLIESLLYEIRMRYVEVSRK